MRLIGAPPPAPQDVYMAEGSFTRSTNGVIKKIYDSFTVSGAGQWGGTGCDRMGWVGVDRMPSRAENEAGGSGTMRRTAARDARIIEQQSRP